MANKPSSSSSGSFFPDSFPVPVAIAKQIQEKAQAEKSQRLQELLDLSYKKLEELKFCLDKESRLTGIDVTEATLAPIRRRQIDVSAKALTFLRQNIQQGSGHETRPDTSFSNKGAGAVGSIVNVNVKNTNLPSKSVSYFNIKKSDEVPKDSWYGSLDRNFAKKRFLRDNKQKQHDKLVSSMAGLNLAGVASSSQLQPDEKYNEIGLPLPRSNPIPSVSRSVLFDFPNEEKRFAMNSMKPFWNYPPEYPIHISQTYLKYPYSLPSVKEVGYETKLPGQAIKLPPPQGPPPPPPLPPPPPPPLPPHQINGSRLSDDLQGRNWFETNLDGNMEGFKKSSHPYFENTHHAHSGAFDLEKLEEINKFQLNSSTNETGDGSSKSSESCETRISYSNESTKPFEMADYYKYSSKFRKQVSSNSDLKLDISEMKVPLLLPKKSDKMNVNNNSSHNKNFKSSVNFESTPMPPEDIDKNTPWITGAATFV